MRRILLIFAAVALVLAVEIVWLAPATLVDTRLQQASAGTLRLAQTEGTIWHARGILTSGGTRLPLAWNLDFWPLLGGELRLHIVPYAGTESGPPRADIRVSKTAVSIREAALVVPAPMLATMAVVPPPWFVGGDVEIMVTTFDWRPPANQGGARIVWRRAQLTAPGASDPVDLGTVTIELTAVGDGVGGPVRNDGGDLGVQGELAFRSHAGMDITLTLVPRDPGNTALAGALASLGARDGAGWRFEWRVPPR